MCFRHPHEDDFDNNHLSFGDNLAEQYFKHIHESCPPINLYDEEARYDPFSIRDDGVDYFQNISEIYFPIWEDFK